MNTKQIDCVLELSHTLNFSRAAENLFISQPSLTYQVQSLENEIGFKLFDRSGKGAVLTPAGEQFCTNLHHIKDEIKFAIEQGQNLNSKYSESLNICLPMRSVLYLLPEIMKEFSKEMPHVSLNINFIYGTNNIDSFLRGEQDILFAFERDIIHIPHINYASIFQSHIYCVTKLSDPLTKHNLITAKDLSGRTLMVGGGSPPELISVQNRVINTVPINTINSYNHETTLTNILADKGICLVPGMANDHNGEFSWIPFDCDETINCVLCFHSNDMRESTKYFIELTKKAYENTGKLPL